MINDDDDDFFIISAKGSYNIRKLKHIMIDPLRSMLTSVFFQRQYKILC